MERENRILVVDDEKLNVKLLTAYLHDDYKIMAARDGRQALEAAAGPLQPDLVLLDIMMPDISGYEVVKQLKGNPRTAHIPVIFISALDNVDDEARGFELGAVDFITKPFNPVIVRARVKTHMQLKRKTDLLERLASIDGLTEIPNRRCFDETLEREIRRSERNGSSLSLLLIDIDYFKKYNDLYGHVAGDDCLRRVARVISDNAKRASDFTARYGGEEFGVILPETDGAGALCVAKHMQSELTRLTIPHEASEVAAYVSISIGILTAVAARGSNGIQLVEAADRALYQAKMNGRNQVCCL